jgi:hypothetical protein
MQSGVGDTRIRMYLHVHTCIIINTLVAPMANHNLVSFLLFKCKNVRCGTKSFSIFNTTRTGAFDPLLPPEYMSHSQSALCCAGQLRVSGHSRRAQSRPGQDVIRPAYGEPCPFMQTWRAWSINHSITSQPEYHVSTNFPPCAQKRVTWYAWIDFFCTIEIT